jgi:hypothetical protein
MEKMNSEIPTPINEYPHDMNSSVYYNHQYEPNHPTKPNSPSVKSTACVIL